MLINYLKILSSQKLGGNQLPVFAVLSSKNITFYESESPETHYLKDLALNDIHFLEVYIVTAILEGGWREAPTEHMPLKLTFITNNLFNYLG